MIYVPLVGISVLMKASVHGVPLLTAVLALGGPRCTEVDAPQAGGSCSCSTRAAAAPVCPHGRLQAVWGLCAAWEWGQSIGGQTVPQGPGQLQPPEAVGHAAPPGLWATQWTGVRECCHGNWRGRC